MQEHVLRKLRDLLVFSYLLLLPGQLEMLLDLFRGRNVATLKFRQAPF